ncbi:DUF6491 family protein [Sandaracinobacter sp. RS1-74]|uniref:DUF6491 family protein n=1 Tax=Sandaracinobacteroides sayramensis TaxID=2913411 RepID=UPI001ED9DED7|nr:DUF6491 family protein [Sandaracinobacteroides sayramensis]MCG2842169.1 DUF6491 family protein [Sandaracinobacteroides sayramensis]
MHSDRMRAIAAALVAAGLALGATAATAKDKTPPTDPATLKATGEPRNCIPSNGVSTVKAGSDALMFRESANRWYRNDLRSSCPGLRDDRVLVFRNQTSGSQYCEMDSFDLVDTMTRTSFGSCTLGKFTPVEVPKGTKFQSR